MSDERPYLAALDAAEPRPAPSDDRELKKNYAQRLSHASAQMLADELRGPLRRYGSVFPTTDGQGHEGLQGASKGRKRLDVRMPYEELGLLLGGSVKTLNFADQKTQRYTKNMVRIDLELRAEAEVIHRRQPFAVLVAFIFLPLDACDDGDATAGSDAYKSSFAHAVLTYRERARREDASDRRWIDSSACTSACMSHWGRAAARSSSSSMSTGRARATDGPAWRTASPCARWSRKSAPCISRGTTPRRSGPRLRQRPTTSRNSTSSARSLWGPRREPRAAGRGPTRVSSVFRSPRHRERRFAIAGTIC